jgi:hypothetical protein
MEDPQISQNGTNVQERGGTLFSWPIFFCFTSIRFSYLVDLTFSGEGGGGGFIQYNMNFILTGCIWTLSKLNIQSSGFV